MSTKQVYVYAFVEKYFSFVVNFVAVVVLSRLLAPSEIGLFSVASAIIALIQMVREFGIGAYLSYEKELRPIDIRSAFGLSLVVSGIIFVLVALAAAPAARFYGHDGLAHLLLALGASLLLMPFSAISYVLMRRELNFGQYSLIAAATNLVYNGLAILLAWYGYSYMSMAWANLVSAVVSVALVALVPLGRDRFIPSLVEWRKIARFGGTVFSSNVVLALSERAPDLILGKAMNFETVGLFSRATGLTSYFSMFMGSAIWPASVAVLSDHHRRGIAIGPHLLTLIHVMTIFGWLYFIFVYFSAERLILLFFGPTWMAATPILEALAVGGVAFSLSGTNWVAMLAIGRPDVTLKVSLLDLVLRSAAILIGVLVWRDVVAVAFWFAAAQFVTAAIWLVVLAHHQICSSRMMAGLVVRNASVCGVAFAAGLCAERWLTPGFGMLPAILISGAAIGIAGLAAMVASKHPLLAEARDYLARWVPALRRSKQAD
jgi:O-antigen/teichoic acid export membrane protein